MRVLRLALLGLLAYALAMVFLFPAAPVIDRLRPQLGPVALDGVSGKLFSGVINSVRSTDDLLPLEFSDVAWRVAPRTLLSGGAGARLDFSGYGGGGDGLVQRQWNGDIVISDFSITAKAKALEPLLPVPIASFSGDIVADIDTVKLENQLLSQFDGDISWRDARLETPVPTALGNVDISIRKGSEASHNATVKASGGDVSIDGTISISASGDFIANIVLIPAASASPAVRNGLSQIGTPDANGRVRFRQSGNVNRLM